MFGIGGKKLVGIVMLAPYEVQTTEYDTTLTYAPNDPLRAVASNTALATGGLITNAGVTAGTNCICGIVSKGVTASNHHNQAVLQFWTHWERGTAGN
jgi:hypothetical protein